VTGDLLVPGTPTLVTNGINNFGGVVPGTGSTSPTGYQVVLNNVSLRYLRTRTTPSVLPGVTPPPAPKGTRSVTLTQTNQSPGDFSTLLNLTLQNTAGMVTVPPGTYGNFTANGGVGFVLGVAGTNQPAVYNLQNLTLNGTCTLKVVGPILLTVSNGFVANGFVGSSNNPAWLQLQIASGGFTVNGNCTLYGLVLVPNGMVTINASSALYGISSSDQFTLNAGGLVQWAGSAATNVPPAITQQPVNVTTNVGGTASFSVTATGTAPLHYQWYFNSGVLANATNSVLTLTGVTTNQAGAYSAVVSNVAGSVTSSNAVLTVNVPPVITQQPVNVTTNAGGTASFSVTATGTAPLHYQWYFNSGVLANATNSVLTLTGVTTNQAGAYSAVVSNVAGSVTSSNAVLTVNVPPVITQQPVNVTTNAGGTASFSVTATGTLPLSYQWYFNSGVLANATNSVLTLTGVTTNQAGAYSAVVSNVAGSVTSSNAVLTVNVCISVLTPPADQTNCPNTTAAFNVIAIGTGVGYQWYQGTTLLGGQTNSMLTLPNVAATNAGTYCVVISGACGGPLTNYATLTILTSTGATGPTNLTLVAGQTAVLAARPSGSGPFSFLWRKDDLLLTGQSTSTLTLPNVATNDAGSYCVVVSGACGGITNCATVTVDQAPAVTVAAPPVITWPSNQLVLSGTVTDDGQPSGGTLTSGWSAISGPGSVNFAMPVQTNVLTGVAITNPISTMATFSAPGSYLVQLTADDGMSTNQAQVTVIVNQAPTVTATATPLVNLPQTAVLTGSVNDDGLPNGTVTSLWTQSSGPGVVTFADPTSPTTTASFSVSGIYILSLTASDGAASDTTNVTVIANSPPNVSVTANPQVFNLGSSSTLTGVVSDDGLPNGTLTFAWSQVSGPGTVTFSSPNSTNTTASFSMVGNYALQLTANDSAATGSANISLTVLSNQPTSQSLQLIVPGAQTNAPNNVLVFDIFNDILVVGSNIGSDQLQLSMTVSNATLMLGATNGLIWVDGADGSSNIVVQGTLDDINAALDELAYVPITNFVGSDTLVVSVTDVAQGGGSISDSNTVAISVVNADQAPAVYAGVTYPLSGSVNLLFPGDSASLWAIVYPYDEGLPNGPLTFSWSQLDGPGTAAFANSNALDTAVSFTQAGTYDLQFSASDGVFSSSVIVSVTVITPDAMPSPSVFAGSFQEITLPASAALNGFVYTNGPIANSQILWSQISGPGSVTFADSGSPVTTASFSAPGLYQLRLEMDQQQWWWWWTWWSTLASDTVYVQVDPATGENQAPVVYAGPARTVLVNTPVQLNGQVSDDGLPAGTLTSVWQFVDGPASVQFTDSNSPVTTVVFTSPGQYDLQLSASDSDLTSASTEQFTVVDASVANQPPVVNSGGSIDFSLFDGNNQITCATVTDDGLPAGVLNYNWTQISGPMPMTIYDPWDLQPSVRFLVPGQYVLRLTADDGQLASNSNLTVIVGAPANQAPKVDLGPDFTLDLPTNSVTLTPQVSDDSLPAGSTLTYQWSLASGPTASDGTPATVTFSNPTSAVTTVTFDQPDVGTSDNGVIYQLRLDVSDSQYTTTRYLNIGLVDPSTAWNQPPIVDAGPDATNTLPDSYQMQGSVSDDTLPWGWYWTSWSLVDGPCQVDFADSGWLQTPVTFYAPGVYHFRLLASDYFLVGSADVTITVLPASSITDQGPEVDAGGSFSIPVGQATQLQGSVTDNALPVGAALTTGWSLVSGPDQITFSDPSLPTAMVTFDMAGTYVLSLTADDGIVTNSANVTVTVYDPTDGNEPPVVSAGTNKTIVLPALASLIGTVSDDGLPGPGLYQNWSLTYNWSLVSGPVGVNILNSGALETPVQFSLPGTYVFQLTANDGALQNSAAVTVTVLPATNQTLLVSAGPDQTILFPNQASLSGTVMGGAASASGALTALWSQLSGPGTVAFDDPAVMATTASFSVPGIYGLQLSVSNGSVGSIATLSIIVEQAPAVALASPPAITWPANQLVLTGTVVDDGLPVGNVLNQVWTQVSGPGTVSFDTPVQTDSLTGTVITNQPMVTATFSAPGTYTIQLAADDGLGTNQAQVAVFVNGPPMVSLTNPTNTAVLALSAPVALQAEAIGLTGIITNVAFFDGTDLLGLGTALGDGTNYVFAWPVTNLAVSTHYLTAVATDNNGLSGTSALVQVVFSDPPYVNAGPNRVVTNLSNAITLNGVVTHDLVPASVPLSSQWTVLSSPGNVTFGDSTAPVTTATFDTQGIYVLQLAAGDDFGSNRSTMEVRADVLCNVTPPSGIVAWWPGNFSVADVVGGNNAVLQGSAGFAMGEVGPAFQFNGITDYVQVPANTNLDIGQSASGFTIEFWENVTNTGDGSVLSWNNGSANGVYLVRSGSALYVNLVDINGTGHGVGWIGGVFNAYWQHIAVTYDRVGGLARVYENGVIIASQNVGSFVPQTSYDLYFGLVLGNSPIAKGQLDEISLYRRPLNQQEIYSIYASGSVGKCPNDGNQPPVVYAGPDQFVEGVPGVTTLQGQVSDDGLPAGSTLQIQWSVFSGPGAVTFNNPNSAVTSATFSTNGIYVLQLTADDGEAQSSDLMEVRVETTCAVQDPQGLVAWWPANGTSEDVVGGEEAVLVNGANYVAGEVASAFQFNGGDYVWVPKATNYDVGQSAAGFTVEFWENVTNTGDGSVLGWNNGSANGVYLMRSGSSLYVNLVDTNGTGHGVGWIGGVFNAYWQHIAVTYDRVGGLARVYENGVIIASQNVGSFVPQTSYDLYFGLVLGNSPIAKGQLDEISLYRRPLNQQEIYSIYASGSVGKCPHDGNQPPVVYAGPDFALPSATNTALLHGVVTDDGLPVGSVLQIQWTKFSGPGNVIFGNPFSPVSTIKFSTNGLYVLQLTADDGEAQSSDLVEVRVGMPCGAQNLPGLVAWWPANGTSKDVIGGNTALMANGANYTAGEVASAFNFNGTNAYVWVTANTNLDIGQSTNGFTIEFWVKVMDPTSATHGVLSWNNGSALGLDMVQMGTSWVMNLWDTNGTRYQVGWFGGVSTNQWHHMALVYNRLVGMAQVFMDGAILYQQNVGSFAVRTSYDLYLGEMPGQPTFMGQLDEISLYNRPLSSQEIDGIFSTGSAGKCPSDLNLIENQEPTVTVVAPPIITWPSNQLVLNGTVTDDGLPTSGGLNMVWSQIEGPGTVSFTPQTTTNALTGVAITNPVSTVATFSAPGLYVLRLTADDTLLTNEIDVTVTVNQAPIVNAGSDQIIPFGGTATLQGTVQDDGLPMGAVLASQWVEVSGPGMVTFANAKSPTTTATFSEAGVYHLELIADDTASLGMSEMTVTVASPHSNQPPTVYAGPNQVIGGTNVASLNGMVTDDNFFGTGYLYIWWSMQSGPGTVAFANSNAPVTTAAFSQPGTYVLVLSANDSQYTVSSQVSITVYPNNMPPVVNPGPNQSITTNIAYLPGVVTDDGLPTGSPLTVSWSEVSGPAAVLFALPNSAATSVSFGQPGIYVLQLSASDTQYTVSSNVTITVQFNQPPQVSAGPDQLIFNTNQTTLQGWAADDGLPVGSTLQTTWSLVSGPSTVSFSDIHTTNAVVTFGDLGAYQLQLTATDGQLTNTDNVTIIVSASNSIPYQAGDYLYQFASHMGITNFYETNFDDSGFASGQAGFGTYGACIACSVNTTNYVNTYWPGASGGCPDLLLRKYFYVPPGTTNVSMGFTVDNNAQIYINGVLITNADEILQFGQPDPTALQTGWYDHEGCPSYDDLMLFGISTNVWHEGYNLLAVRAYDEGCEAFYDGRIILNTPSDVLSNRPPTIITSSNVFVVFPAMANLTASVQDDGYPLNATKTATWTQNLGPGTVTFSRPTSSFATNDDVSTTAAFSEPGVYTLQLTANDSVYAVSAFVTVVVSAVSNQPPVVSAGSDQTIVIGDSAALDGTASDDGLPFGILDTSWNVVSAPGNVYLDVIDGVTYASFDTVGDYILQFSANDGELTSTANVTIHVVSSTSRYLAGNLQFPQTTDKSIGADLSGTVVDVGQPVGSTLSVAWSAVSGPGVVTFSQVSNGLTNFSAHADFSIGGTYVLRMTASDGELTTSIDALIAVTDLYNGNRAPVVNAGQPMIVPTMAPVALQGLASDDGLPAGGTLTTVWTQLSGPGTVIFGNAAATNTTATFSAQGIYVLQLTASDGELTSSDTISVLATNSTGGSFLVYAGQNLAVSRPNAVSLEGMVVDDGLLPGNSLTYQWSKVSGPGTVTFQTVSNTTDDVTDWLPVDDTEALASATFSADGSYVLRLSGTDTQITNSDDITVNVYGTANLPPVAEIYAPEDGAIITAPTNIIGTASSPILQSYQVRYRLAPPATNDAIPTASSTGWTTLAEGSASVANNTLAVFDPTLLLNGIYEVQLVATDSIGRTAYSEVLTLVVDRNLKIGQFTISFNDLSVPVPGLSLQITRTYDSRAATAGIQGDFGAGWTMDIRNVRLQKNRSLSRNWEEYVTGNVEAGDLSTAYHLDPGSPRIVTITFPDGRVEKFQLTPYPMDQPLAPISYPQWNFTPIGNTPTNSTLVPASYDDTNGNFMAFAGEIPGTADLYDFNYFFDYIGNFNTSITLADLQRYPTLFRYTSAEGYRYLIDEIQGLQSVTDPNGNTLVIATNGLIWSNPNSGTNSVSVAFQRDDHDRITNIVDAAGNAMSYQYDTNDNLVTFIDRTGQTNGFAYTNVAFPHYLTSITDARGVTPVQNEYDADGRLVGNIDAFGNAITYGHDLANNREYVTNRLGQVTINEYDDHGNVTHTIAADGGETFSTYDEDGNVLTATDPLGRTTSYTYDDLDNRTSVTDPPGNTTRFTYGDRRRVTSVTDPRGNSITNTFDALGNLLSMSDPLGHVTTFSYDQNGQPVGMQNALGQTMTFGYDSAGRLAAEQDALGHETDYQRDSNGNLLAQTTTRTTPQDTQTLTVQFQYDEQGRLTNSIFPDGSSAQTIYNAIGKPAVTIDQLGRQTIMEYDDLGRVTRTDYTDGSSESSGYDAEGRRVSSTNRIGQVTRYEYDAVGRLIHTLYFDGTATTNYFDLAGQLIVSTDANGNNTFYGYDAAGRSVAVTNALGQVSRSFYDASGNLTNSVDALGRSTTFIYDALNRRVQTVFADHTTQTTWFDELGRRTYEQDQAGKTTAFGYDTLGRLTAVTNAMGYVTSYAYDELGQQISQTDANLHTTTFEYDSLGRRVKRTLPGNQIETYAYNIGGLLTNKTDFDGYATTYQYDQMSRLVAKLPDASRGEPLVTFAYNTLGLRTNMTDASGATMYQYDNRNRLAQKTKTWGGTGVSPSLISTLNYGYDANGNLTGIASSDANGVNVGYEYDALSRLSAVNDAAAGTTAYGYDAVGNLAGYIYPNNVNSTYTYDSLNRLTNLASGHLLTPIANYAYTVGPAGNRLTATETIIRDPLNPVPRTINRVYTYDNIYRLTGETINGAPASGTASYGYDPVGNRLTRNSTLPTLLFQNFTFDANDRLNTDTYDNNGNTLIGLGFGQTQADQYDFENRLVTRHTPTATISIKYDGDGNRVSKTVTTATNSTTTYYVVDELNPSGYAQVLEEHVSLNSQPSTLNAVYTYGHTLISQDRLDGTWRTSFYGYDGHNNVRYLTDVNGNITDTYDYDAFGNLTAASGDTVNYYLFTSEQFDLDLGLYYLRARYHNPDTGRFWNMDSYEGDNSDPASLHKYTYCGNNPANAYDRSGHDSLMEVTIATGMWTTARAIFNATLGGFAGALAGGYNAMLNGQVSNQEIAQGMSQGFEQGAVTGGFFGAVGGLGAIGQFGVSGLGMAYSGLGFYVAFQSYLNGDVNTGDTEAVMASIGAVLSIAGGVPPAFRSVTGAAGLTLALTSYYSEAAGREQAFIAAYSPGEFIQLGGSTIRNINLRPGTQGWGLTLSHIQKHLFGSGPTSLKTLDPSGNPSIWANHITELYNSPVTSTTSNGMLDIIKTFPKADGSGTFQLGLRLSPKPDGTFDLVTILTKQ
jgi:RHS repeat-associated protein